MKTIRLGDKSVAVEDIQQRLALIGYYPGDKVDGYFGDDTSDAVAKFCHDLGIDEESGLITDKIWAALVDATYNLGDRTLYLRMPYLHGHDVVELQQALGALGFFCGNEDGIFGAHTEEALRRFQLNLGLPSDGIVGAYTFAAIRNLEHSWAGKGSHHSGSPLGFARAADVLEDNSICLFGLDDFTRSIASRAANLAFATNPTSKIVSAEMLSVPPSDDTLLLEIALDEGLDAEKDVLPTVVFSDDIGFSRRLSGALGVARARHPQRAKVIFPDTSWQDAGEERSAQHFAITLLDALCSAL